MKNVIMANEDSVIRVGLEKIFTDVQPKSVFFYATTSSKVFELLDTQKIDVIIFSNQILMDKKDENLFLKKAHELQIKIFIIFLEADYAMLLKWLHCGVNAFVTYGDSHKELKEIFNKALKNDQLNFSKSISETWNYLDGLECLAIIKINLLNKLTPREMEVLILICEQSTNEEIGVILNMSVNTVNTHRKNILVKTGARNMVGLCLYALKLHLLKSQKLVKILILTIMFWNKFSESFTEMNLILN